MVRPWGMTLPYIAGRVLLPSARPVPFSAARQDRDFQSLQTAPHLLDIDQRLLQPGAGIDGGVEPARSLG